MTTIEFVFEITVGVTSTIGLLYCGIVIGRKFGTFENFVLKMLDRLKEKIEK